jgi:hypothetical protein
MPNSISNLTGIAGDLAAVFESINALVNAGNDEKTQELETNALAALEKVRVLVTQNAGGTSPVDQQRDYYRARERELTQIINSSVVPAPQKLKAIDDRAAVRLRLAAALLQEVSFANLLMPEEVIDFETAIKKAHKALRTRIKLKAFVETVLTVSALAASLATKVAML